MHDSWSLGPVTSPLYCLHWGTGYKDLQDCVTAILNSIAILRMTTGSVSTGVENGVTATSTNIQAGLWFILSFGHRDFPTNSAHEGTQPEGTFPWDLSFQ